MYFNNNNNIVKIDNTMKYDVYIKNEIEKLNT